MKELRRETTAVILVEVSEEEALRRLGGRRTCEKNPSHIYHLEFDPPKNDEVCDIDGGKLIVRDDDKPEVIRNRLAQYREKTEPLIGYYEDRGILQRVNGELTAGRGRGADPRPDRHATPRGGDGDMKRFRSCIAA